MTADHVHAREYTRIYNCDPQRRSFTLTVPNGKPRGPGRNGESVTFVKVPAVGYVDVDPDDVTRARIEASHDFKRWAAAQLISFDSPYLRGAGATPPPPPRPVPVVTPEVTVLSTSAAPDGMGAAADDFAAAASAAAGSAGTAELLQTQPIITDDVPTMEWPIWRLRELAARQGLEVVGSKTQLLRAIQARRTAGVSAPTAVPVAVPVAAPVAAEPATAMPAVSAASVLLPQGDGVLAP